MYDQISYWGSSLFQYNLLHVNKDICKNNKDCLCFSYQNGLILYSMPLPFDILFLTLSDPPL